MRILHVIESHTVHTQRVVESQLRGGHDVRLLTFHDYVGQGPVSTVRYWPWLARMPYSHHWVGIDEVARAVRGFRPDVVHGHYLSTAALYLGACFKFPKVATAMGSDILRDPRAAHARVLIRLAHRWIDRFTSVAPHITRRMIELGVPSERIETFPWGVDTEVFHPPRDPPERGLIASTRNFEPVYNVRTLLRAFTSIAGSVPHARLVLYGDGSQRESLLALAQSSPHASRVEFPGRIPPTAVADRLRVADVYVSTALSDGASASLLEAMASGLVPVACDIEANRAWISDGANGLLFPPGDAAGLARCLERALVDSGLRQTAFETNPRIVSERASWASSMARLEGIYQDVISR